MGFAQWVLPQLAVVLCLQPCLAARAFDTFDSFDPAPKERETITWGDIWSEFDEILRRFEASWFLVSLLLLAVICWTATTGAAAHPPPEEQPVPVTWPRCAVASLFSHAAGIVGFIGFEKIVVARIVSTSSPGEIISFSNLLLYTSLLISFLAVFASMVFLTVDYLRRLAIESAQQRQLRLVLQPTALEKTGLGISLLALTAILFILYIIVLCTDLPPESTSSSEGWQGMEKKAFLERLGSFGAVLLYFLNLRNLVESPRVPFHYISTSTIQDTSLADYLKSQRGAGFVESCSWLRSSIARVSRALAGEDLELFINAGSQPAFFPQQRLTPWLHVAVGLLLLGCFPRLVHISADRFFQNLQVNNVRLVSLSSVMVPRFEEGEVPDKLWLLVGNDSASVVVAPAFEQTARVTLECGGLHVQQHPLHHSLRKYDDRSATFPFPPDLTGTCKVTLQGLSKQATTYRDLLVMQQSTYNLCGCSADQCKCCPGFQGNFTGFSKSDLTPSLMEALKDSCKRAPCQVSSSNQRPGDQCSCNDGFVGKIFWQDDVPVDACKPAPCKVDNSNNLRGTSCRCSDGFTGDISWNGSQVHGSCTPAQCNLKNSNQLDGPACHCGVGYLGNVTWRRDVPVDGCEPSPCRIENSNGKLGPECRCAPQFRGNLTWTGTSWHGSCVPGPCEILNSNGESGSNCRCLPGYHQAINWKKGIATGSCTPLPCDVENSNQQPGPACACLDGFDGNISWRSNSPEGQCTRIPCNISGSNRMAGPDCKCLPGSAGKIVWHGSQPEGSCTPKRCVDGIRDEMSICRCRPSFDQVNKYEWEDEVRVECKPSACSIPNSNQLPGEECRCLDGFTAEKAITWEWERNGSDMSNRSTPIGKCVPADCKVDNSKGKGLDCHCHDGYVGKITWSGDAARGECKMAECRVDNSNYLPGLQCQCLQDFYGKISWQGDIPTGACIAKPLCSGVLRITDEDDDEITATLRLAAPLTDVDGVTCQKDQFLMFKGKICGHEDAGGDIAWISATAVGQPRCKFKLISSCRRPGLRPHRISAKAFHQALPGLKDALPSSCARAQQPTIRCSFPIRLKAWGRHRFTTDLCDTSSGSKLLEFQGRPCGYDLIQWESVALLTSDIFQGGNRTNHASCKENISARVCGEPPLLALPRSCSHISQPASFQLYEYRHDPPRMTTTRIFALWENGECQTEPLAMPANTNEQLLTLIAEKHKFWKAWQGVICTWHSDGSFLFFRLDYYKDVYEPVSSKSFSLAFRDPPFATFDHKYFVQPQTKPDWWIHRLQRQAAVGGYVNEDLVAGCEMVSYHKGICYQVWFGEEIRTHQSDEHECVRRGLNKEFALSRYLFTEGTPPIYRSNTHCHRVAAFEEVVLQIVDVPNAETALAPAHTPCRTVIHLTMDVAALRSVCHNGYEQIYKQKSGNLTYFLETKDASDTDISWFFSDAPGSGS